MANNKSGSFIDLRAIFLNKKKPRSFPNRQAFEAHLASETATAPVTKHKARSHKEPKISREKKRRSISTADVALVMHNAVLREDSGALERVLRDENLVINDPNPNGLTALLQSCTLGNLACIKLLLNAGADLYVKCPDSRTALQLAVTNGHFEVAEFLISVGSKDEDIRNGVQPIIRTNSKGRYSS